jgi:hypothetical protein
MARYKPCDKIWAIAVYGEQIGDLIITPGKHAGVIIEEYDSSRPQAEEFYLSFIYDGPLYVVDVFDYPTPPTGYWLIPEPDLEPRHDPYEGDSVGSWDTTPLFNPTKQKEST